jgi:energy-converting hydrogenase Eha subunit G
MTKIKSTAFLEYTDLNLEIPHSSPSSLITILAANELKNESVTAGALTYNGFFAFSKYEHDALHSEINGSDVNFTHSFILHPIYPRHIKVIPTSLSSNSHT